MMTEVLTQYISPVVQFIDQVRDHDIPLYINIVGSHNRPEKSLPWNLSDVDLVTIGRNTPNDPFQIEALIRLTETMDSILMGFPGSFVFTTFRQETSMPYLLVQNTSIGTPIHWLHYPTPWDLLREPQNLALNLLGDSNDEIASQARSFVQNGEQINPFLKAIMGPRMFLDETFRLVFANPWINSSFRTREAAQKLQYSIRWATVAFLDSQNISVSEWEEILGFAAKIPTNTLEIIKKIVEMRKSRIIPSLEELKSEFINALFALTELFIESKRRIQ